LSAPTEVRATDPEVAAKPKVRRPRLILVGSVLYLALIFGVMLWLSLIHI